MDDFKLTLDDLTFFSQGLSRPESLLPTKSGIIYASDSRGGIAEIQPDGRQRLIGSEQWAKDGFAPNGFAMLPDGSFLIANIGSQGGVWRLTRDGDLRPWLMEVDGIQLGMPNFVLLDDQHRIWINGLPRRMQGTFTPGANEGYIILIDDKGARLVADGVDVPNELRIDPVRKFVYTNESFLGRMIRFSLGADGSLSNRETVAEFERTDHLDGLNLDADGFIWTTSVVVNRLYRVNPDTGDKIKVLEDLESDWAERAAQAVETGTFNRALLYEQNDLTLKNISSISFGGPDMRTAYLGSLCGDRVVSFRAPVAGLVQAHWNLGPF